MRDNQSKYYFENEMSRLLGVNEKFLRNAFKRRFGKSFSKYQSDSKLSVAYSMLINYPGMKLREIADSLGFCDEFYMSRLLKKKYGLSPSEIKKSI